MQSERLQRPRLLVFTLGDGQETRRRRLLPAASRATERRLHRACLDNTFEAGRGAGFVLEASSPTELDLANDVSRRRQSHGTFGQRISAELRRAFAEGPGLVALVGSDVPDLEATHLERTRQELAEDPSCVVIGPSPDGGFYLLASAQPLDDALAEVRWCCRETLASLKRALARRGRQFVLLPALADLDGRSDLEQWLAGLGRTLGWRKWSALAARLLRVFADLRQPAAERILGELLPGHGHRLVARGPPV